MSAAERVVVRLPKLATSFLPQQPQTNNHYEEASRVSKDWVTRECELGEKGRKVVKQGDFTYFVAIAVPVAELGRFQVFSDWVHWVFPFDDEFDNGRLKDDPEGAKEVLDNLVESLHGTADPATQFVRTHNDISVRIKEVSDVDVQMSSEVANAFPRMPQQVCNILKAAISKGHTDLEPRNLSPLPQSHYRLLCKRTAASPELL